MFQSHKNNRYLSCVDERSDELKLPAISFIFCILKYFIIVLNQIRQLFYFCYDNYY